MAAIAAVPITTLSGSSPTRRDDPANERFEETGIVHHPEEDDGEGQERCRRRHAPDAVHREAADLAGKAAGDRGHHGHERQGDDDRRDAKENQPDERGDGGDAQQGEHRQLRPASASTDLVGVLSERRRRLERQHRHGRQLDGVPRHAHRRRAGR